MAIYRCEICNYEFAEEDDASKASAAEISPNENSLLRSSGLPTPRRPAYGSAHKKQQFSDLKKCPSCGAKKEKMKKAKDFFEEAITGLQKYREGTPKSELEVGD